MLWADGGLIVAQRRRSGRANGKPAGTDQTGQPAKPDWLRH